MILLLIILFVALFLNSRQSYDYKDLVSLALAIGIIAVVLKLLCLF